MAKTDYTSVDDYIAAQPEAVRPALQRVRRILSEALPDAEEGIGYQVPVMRVRGKYALYFAGYARHFAIYPATSGVIEALGDALTPYRSGKATFRFELADPIPEDLIRRIAAARAEELA
jgi:uncharacterized protein YdhG (YjbR/CyaY superfamily)